MTDSWDERRKAQEDIYFEQANKAALARFARAKSQPARLSPATGGPMEQMVLMGVVIDRCPTSGGVWLDAGELEQLVHAEESSGSTLQNFIASLPTNTAIALSRKETQVSPISGKTLRAVSVGDVSVGFCEESKGIWLDGRELERFVSTSHQTLTSSTKAFFQQLLGRS